MGKASLDFSGLGDLAKAPGRAVTGWQPLTPADLGDGSILAFDQSLAATGWVKVTSLGGVVRVVSAGVIRDEHGDGLPGVERDLMRGVTVFEHSFVLIDQVAQTYEFAHESPPNPNAIKGGGTASLMAAQAVRNAAALAGVKITMLGAQPGKKLICGSTKATKAEAHAVLKETCFPWIEGSEKVTNEATRDALIVALLWLHRQPKEGAAA